MATHHKVDFIFIGGTSLNIEQQNSYGIPEESLCIYIFQSEASRSNYSFMKQGKREGLGRKERTFSCITQKHNLQP
jgi:hypothetical protein